MADVPMEETEAYQAGMKAQRLKSLEERQKEDNASREKDHEDHQKECRETYNQLWSELRSHSRLLYIGFGLLAAIEVVIGLVAAFGGAWLR